MIKSEQTEKAPEPVKIKDLLEGEIFVHNYALRGEEAEWRIKAVNRFILEIEHGAVVLQGGHLYTANPNDLVYPIDLIVTEVKDSEVKKYANNSKS